MGTQTVRLIDSVRTVLATARVSDAGDQYGGTIDLRSTPVGVRAIFDEFEEVVNGQMFAVLDQIQERIEALGVRAEFEDGSAVAVSDLQVFPATGEASFRVAAVPSPA